MGGSYTADEQNAAAIAAGIADDADNLAVGKVTKTTSATTAVVTHGFDGTPDFIIYGLVGANSGVTLTHSANTTSVTFTRGTAAASWSVSYILGYTA